MAKKLTLTVVILVALLAIGYFIYILFFSGTEQEAAQDTSAQQNTVRTEPIELLDYTVVEKSQSSEDGCDSAVFKIKVAEGADDIQVEATEQDVISENKEGLDQLTVLTYEATDTDEFIRNNDFTVSKSVYGTCEQ